VGLETQPGDAAHSGDLQGQAPRRARRGGGDRIVRRGFCPARRGRTGHMTAYVALLRAVNVGGTGKRSTGERKARGQAGGFGSAPTYIASGNVVFSSDRGEEEVRAGLEKRLAAYAGKPVGVVVRTGAEMARVLAGNPFPDAKPNWTVAIFLN